MDRNTWRFRAGKLDVMRMPCAVRRQRCGWRIVMSMLFHSSRSSRAGSLEHVREFPKMSASARALNYPLKNWAVLIRYASDGKPEMDNGAAERSLGTLCWERTPELSLLGAGCGR